MSDELFDPFNRMLGEISTPEAVRAFERDGDGAAMWAALCDSGFVDALVAEADGGVGLSPADVAPLLIACGTRALPVAFGETMVARALAAGAGSPLSTDGPVLLWPHAADGTALSLVPPLLGGAGHALVQQGGTVTLWTVAPGERDGFGLVPARLDAPTDATFPLAENTLFHWATALTAAAMAGAMGAVLDMTLTHVNDRQQFGRPLAKFQAIQQQVSVLAERVATTNVAARIALSRPMPGPSALDVGVGKSVANGGASIACAIAHAAHGAIGITAEHDLTLHARRLKRAQLAFGSGAYWAARIGAARLEETGTSIDFIRALRQD